MHEERLWERMIWYENSIGNTLVRNIESRQLFSLEIRERRNKASKKDNKEVWKKGRRKEGKKRSKYLNWYANRMPAVKAFICSLPQGQSRSWACTVSAWLRRKKMLSTWTSVVSTRCWPSPWLLYPCERACAPGWCPHPRPALCHCSIHLTVPIPRRTHTPRP